MPGCQAARVLPCRPIRVIICLRALAKLSHQLGAETKQELQDSLDQSLFVPAAADNLEIWVWHISLILSALVGEEKILTPWQCICQPRPHFEVRHHPFFKHPCPFIAS